MSTWAKAVGLVGDWLGVGPGLAAISLTLVLFLSAGTALRGWSRWRRSDLTARSRWRSVATWWTLTLLFLGLLALGPSAVTVVMALLSLVLVWEALRLVDGEAFLPAAVAVVGGTYLWAWLDWPSLFLGALPAIVAVLAAMEIFGRQSRFRRARSFGRAIFLALIGPSYAVAVAYLPAPSGLPESGMGWFAVLFVLTELNDSAQAWGGRSFGMRRMAPRLSPGKTWAGFWSGVGATTAASVLVAPLVTAYGRSLPFGAGSLVGAGSLATAADPGEATIIVAGWPWLWSAGLGIVVAVAGIAGDLLESSLKRRAGVKDSGDLLPGHGGLMDRLDSLAMTAPVFFAVTWILWF